MFLDKFAYLFHVLTCICNAIDSILCVQMFTVTFEKPDDETALYILFVIIMNKCEVKFHVLYCIIHKWPQRSFVYFLNNGAGGSSR